MSFYSPMPQELQSLGGQPIVSSISGADSSTPLSSLMDDNRVLLPKCAIQDANRVVHHQLKHEVGLGPISGKKGMKQGNAPGARSIIKSNSLWVLCV